MSGRLFIIATPVGNLSDLSPRASAAFNDCDMVLAEDTRVTIKLLNHLGLKKSLISCHEFNEGKRLDLLETVAQRNMALALVCDAGTPLICDPGYRIVQKAVELGIQIIPIPGPSAFLLALVASGLPLDRFCFEGFLPERTSDRKKRLDQLRHEERTLVFYIATHDQLHRLIDIYEAFGNRRACLARELTKLYEQFLRGTLSELVEQLKTEKLRGEFVLVVEGTAPGVDQRTDKAELIKQLQDLITAGAPLKEAATILANSSGWSKSEIYKLGLEHIRKPVDV